MAVSSRVRVVLDADVGVVYGSWLGLQTHSVPETLSYSSNNNNNNINSESVILAVGLGDIGRQSRQSYFQSSVWSIRSGQ